MSKTDGGPAFPIPGLQHDEDFNGMTLRDYFAAKAMQGLITEPPWNGDSGFASVHAWSEDFESTGNPCDRFAFAAYKMADAMLKARG